MNSLFSRRVGQVVFCASALVAIGACGSSSSSSSPSGTSTDSGVADSGASAQQIAQGVASVKQAILGNPDAATRRAMVTLNQTLTIEERQYLRNMHWTGQTRDTLEADPAYNKALVSLSIRRLNRG